jgi:LemA protein
MLKHNVGKAWANVDVLLRQRHDELAKLIALCAEYMRHERALLERVARARNELGAARSRGDARELGALDGELRAALTGLIGLVEAYPQLKASEQFAHLQKRIAEIENAIADRREFFNATVTTNNVEVQTFPYSLLAVVCGMRAFDLFAFDGSPPRARAPKRARARAE